MKGKPDICVMAPTIRNPDFVKGYVENARENDFDTERLHFVLITEDFNDKDSMREMLDNLNVSGEVFGESERHQWYEENEISEYSDVVPAASHAETSFGLLYMWAHPEFEYGIFLDDDTQPHEDFNFFSRHMSHLDSKKEVEHVSSNKNWVNVMYQNIDRHGLYPRGYPYSAMDEEISTEKKQTNEIVASQGLWTNVPDLDAVRILMDGNLEGQAETLTKKEDYKRNFAAKTGNYLTVCSMNLAFKREIIPAFYQFPMDDNEWDIGRFDDIWSGITLKKATDMLNKSVINGFPLCIHNKAKRSTFGDLNNEVPALELNEHFWEAINEAPNHADGYFDAYRSMIKSVKDYDFSDYANEGFIDFTVEYMEKWLSALEKLEDKK
ncbi:MAG: putative glucan-protein synthase, RGP family protein [Candidatus Nanosalina sp. J07AB43]|nr:MAG: putative glucan-protein synthase, RGP family protein [Candidatus Nanosalina sp. J07AB43]